MVRLQHCFGHDHVNFLLLPFLFPSMPDHGGGPLCMMLSKPAKLSQRHNAFLVEQAYFQGLGLSEMWMPAWEPLSLPWVDRDMIRSPSLYTEEFLVLQFPNVLTEICPSGKGWEGGGLLYNTDLMLGFAH